MKSWRWMVAVVVLAAATVASYAGVMDKANTNMVIWMNPDRGLSTAAGRVTQWQDQSAYANHMSQGTASLRMYVTNVTLDAGVRRGLHGNGAEYMGATTAFTGTVFEAYCVTRSTNWGASPEMGLISTRQATSAGWGFGVPSGANALYIRPFTAGSNTVISVGISLLSTNTYAFSGILQGSTIIPRVMSMAGTMTTNVGTYVTDALTQPLGIGKTGLSGGNWVIGEMFDVIVFNRVLTGIERVFVDNYIMAKYGTNTAWSGSHYTGWQAAKGSYAYDVFGVGRISAGNEILTNSMAGLAIEATGGTLGDNDWVLAGTLGGDNYRVITDLPGGVSQRWQRVWYVDKTGSVDVNLTFKFSDAGMPAPSGGSVYLLYSPTPSYSFTTSSISPTISGDAYTFAVPNASLASGYYTIGTTETLPTSPTPVTKALGPGGLAYSGFSTNLLLWARADQANGRDTNGAALALPAVGSNVATWKDLSAYGNDLLGDPTPANQPLFTNATMEAGSRYGFAFDGVSLHRFATANGFTGGIFTVYAMVSSTNYDVWHTANNLGGTRDGTSGWDWDTSPNLYLRIVTNGGYSQPVIYSLANSNSFVFKAVMDGTYAQLFTMTMAGVLSSNTAPSPAPTVMVPSTSTYVIGGWPHGGGGNGWPGNVFETIVLNRTLTTIENIMVENYLASKYMTNTTQSVNDYYTGDTPANGDYDFDVFGILNLDGTNVLNNNGSAGFGIAERGIGPTLDTGEYVFAGHNGLAATLVPLEGKGGFQRWGRIWCVQPFGSIDTLFTFKWSAAGVVFNSGGPILLYRPGTAGSWTFLNNLTTAVSGDQVTFTVPAATLQTGYYTLGVVPRGTIMMVK